MTSLPASLLATVPAGLPAGYKWLALPGGNPQTGGAVGTGGGDATPLPVTTCPHDRRSLVTGRDTPRARGARGRPDRPDDCADVIRLLREVEP